ncbi:MAG: glycosyltransferase family 2 protein [Candidatus Thermoplasmatota archaeon]|nr:glycosyltransferase family 2 protein [Candidatus Thermoplasmatota archaeon]
MLASVIIYTYKRKEFILKAVESVSSQSIPRSDYEIIVVKAFRDQKIDSKIDGLVDKNLFVDEKGHGKKLVPAVIASRGEIIFLLDDDDEFLPTKMAQILELFKHHSDLVFAHHSITKIDENGLPFKGGEEAVPPRELMLDTSLISRRSISGFIKYRANWYSSCMAFSRKSLLKHLSFLEEVDQSIDPFLFFMAISTVGKMILVPDRLTKYRVHVSTTNYLDQYASYIFRKHTFYSNTLRIYLIALRMTEGLPSEIFVRASFFNMKLITTFLSDHSSRREIFTAILSVLREAKTVFTRYSLVWLTFSAMKFATGRLALRLYYLYNLVEFNRMTSEASNSGGL